MEKRTIIIILGIIGIIILVLGIIFLTRNTSTSNKENGNPLTQDKSISIVIGAKEHKTFSVKTGTEGYSLILAFAPKNTEAWAMNQ